MSEQISGTSYKGLDSILKEERSCDKTCDKACEKDQIRNKGACDQSKGVDMDILNDRNKSNNGEQQHDGCSEQTGASNHNDGQKGIDIDLTDQGVNDEGQQSKYDQVKQKSGDMTEKTKQKAGEASQATKDSAGEAMDKTKEGASTLKEKFSAGLQKTKELFTGIDGDESRDPSGLPDMQADQRKEHAERRKEQEEISRE
jgi:hypothetical protein